MIHDPVLLQEVLQVLNPQKGEFIIDGTLDGGGHAREILKLIGEKGTLLGIDWDKDMIDSFPKYKNVTLVNDNFRNLEEVMKKNRLKKADGLLLDLGFSSIQLEKGRGFSFKKNEPLLMTYNNTTRTAKDWLKKINEKELERIIREYGGERFAGRIARNIKSHMPIETSGRLAEVTRQSVPRNYERGRIDPATRTFMALRIFVNQEFENIRHALESLPNIMEKGGRVAIISFHSDEDRIIKHAFQKLVKEKKAELIMKKPIVATEGEVRENPRSRSAKLRALRFL